jgi:hypothetical protein
MNDLLYGRTKTTLKKEEKRELGILNSRHAIRHLNKWKHIYIYETISRQLLKKENKNT